MMLQLRLHVQRLGAITLGTIALALAAGFTWAWYLVAHSKPPAPTAAVSAPAPQAARKDTGLAEFQQVLSPRKDTDAQVKLLFDLAKRNKLVLSKGQYKSSWDGNGQFSTYQIVLPLSGRYQDVWAFAGQALAALPYAALDEISFKREGIADAQTESRLRFTLYLQGAAP